MKIPNMAEDHGRKKTLIKLCIFIAATLIIFFLVSNDYRLYNKTIVKITGVTDQYEETKEGFDGTYTYKEKYYTQTITGIVKNGDLRGKQVTMANKYGQSGVYDTKYSKGDVVFCENIKTAGGHLTGQIAGAKRDNYLVLVLTLLFGMFILICGKEGILTIISLTLNMVAFYFVLTLYLKGVNLLLMTIPMVIFFSAMLLVFMYGFNEKVLVSLIATLIAAALTTAMAYIIIALSPNIDYDFMDYLIQPYEQKDCNTLFVSEVLIGCLGAVMDVVVTMVMTVDQIVKTSRPGAEILSKNFLRTACKNVGDDIVGTMVSVMFFTNIAACIPFFILAMRNGVGIGTVLHYNIFFEVARFLTGSIATVMAIPISALVAITYYRRRHGK